MSEPIPSHTKVIVDSPILFVKKLVGKIYLMRLQCEQVARTAVPGQFVNIKVNQELIPLLRKPFSVCRRSVQEGWIDIVWKIVGKGTRTLAEHTSGDLVNLIGPLGSGFTIPPETRTALLVGGGLGVAPLPFLCEQLLEARKQVVVFLGAKTKDELSLVDVFLHMGVELLLTTEDGSEGSAGLVTDILRDRLKPAKNLAGYHLFSCGPTGFLQAMQRITDEFEVDGQISIETMMGCGFGICMGCPVRLRNGRPGGGLYKLTCIDGPVFDAREVVLDG